MTNKKPLAIDLFCGAGGMSEGILQAGFHIVYSNEINKDAALTYKKRHEQLGLIHGKNTWLDVCDIKNIRGRDILNKISHLENFKNQNIEISAIFGGPPCQGFSRAGRQNVEDYRNMLFIDYLRIISEVLPDYIIFENVPGILDVKFNNFTSIFDNENYKNKDAIKIIIKELKKIGYNVLEYKILNAANYGVPQNRYRLILIGYKNKVKIPKYPNPSHKLVTVKDALNDLVTGEITSRYQSDSINGRTNNIITNKPIKSKDIYNNEKTNHNLYIKERFSLMKPGESVMQLRKRILENGIDLSSKPKLLNYLSKKLHRNEIDLIQAFKNGDVNNQELDLLLTKKNTRIKLNLNKPSNTILTLPDDIISPYDNRIFSVRELARLQSFDDSFIFYGKRTTGAQARKTEVPQYTQVGNAVPPLLAKAIATEIIKCLKSD